MKLKEIIREKALELGFEDAGFTGVEPLDDYIREIDSRPREMYGWVQTDKFNTRRGAGVGQKHKWCKNACIAACPTGALYSPKKMDPLRCIAFNSYYTGGITPLKLREPMGTWVYGCDRCQEVCPRNQPWLNQDLPANGPLMRRAPDFALETLLTMDDHHYVNRVWPLTFYISRKLAAKWQMNAARALGNQGDLGKIPLLIQSLNENPHEIVRGMSAWSLGQLGGKRAKAALEARRSSENGLVQEEIERALQRI